jgi:hypothetical protein
MACSSLANEKRIVYPSTMAALFRHLSRYMTQKIASDPRAREMAAKAAQGVVNEAKQIAKEDDPAYAAGRAVKRALNKLQNR